MKKLFTLLLLTLAAFTFKASAQSGTTCNADFTTQFLSNYTVKFIPVISGDSIYNHHSWNFGDGGSSTVITPTHTYAAAGTYTVQHILKVTNPNGVVVCRDTVYKTVIIQGDCNLQVNFTWHADSLVWNKVHFTNTSIPLDPTDSTKWTFGDGTSSLDANPVHTYANAGTYTVCLTVKKNNIIQLESKTMARDELLLAVRQALTKNPERSVVIAADKNVKYEDVIGVMDLLKQNKVDKVGLL